MNEPHGFTEFQSLMALFGVRPETVDRFSKMMHANGEVRMIHDNWVKMDPTTKLRIKQILNLDSKDDEEDTNVDGADDANDSEDTIGMNQTPDETFVSSIEKGRFEGFKGGLQDYLREVTITVDSNDPNAQSKALAQLRKAQSSEAGARKVARDNVAKASAQRQSITPDDPNAAAKKREFKRREMAAREEHKRIRTVKTV